MKNQKGFTLIEMLIAISVISIIGFILTDIMSQVFRGQNKINTVSLVKQNGQVVLDKLSNEIRSAEKVICNGSAVGGPKDTVVLFRNGNYTRFRFVLPTALASGYFSREDFTQDDIPDGVTDLTLCTETGVIRGQQSFLTDKDSNGVSIGYDGTNPIFEKQPEAGSPDIILIRFRAGKSVSAVTKTPENTVSDGGVLFTTAASVKGGK